MADDWRIDDIRRWHKLNRDMASQHWRDVDLLLEALDGGGDHGDAEDILADIECALDDARSALQMSRRMRSRAKQPSLRPASPSLPETPEAP